MDRLRFSSRFIEAAGIEWATPVQDGLGQRSSKQEPKIKLSWIDPDYASENGNSFFEKINEDLHHTEKGILV